ncbi:hypothetical protein [Roseobacter litoralis]|uniref:hypothetical protein n=1 Tax=Roseobacter litoralis TaxID=42443 RepID=UPI0024949CB2|nr:hypothetical protein [Roseobacter litoralis]
MTTDILANQLGRRRHLDNIFSKRLWWLSFQETINFQEINQGFSKGWITCHQSPAPHSALDCKVPGVT